MDIGGILFITLVWPPISWLMVPLTATLVWTAPFVLAAIAALIAGLILVNRAGAGRKTPWLFLPLATAHAHIAISILSNSDPVLWWLLVEALAIGWLIWVLRATRTGALFLGYFAFVYCALPALAVINQLSLL